jgi:hypothetical protein
MCSPPSLHIFVFTLCFRGSIFLTSPTFAAHHFELEKITLTVPPKGVSQLLLWLGEGTTPLPSTELLPHIDEGQETDTSDVIKESKQEHATNHNFASTSTGAVASIGQNDGGSFPQSSQQVPPSTQTTQEQTESGQHEEDETLEDDVVMEEELAQVQQEIKRL